MKYKGWLAYVDGNSEDSFLFTFEPEKDSKPLPINLDKDEADFEKYDLFDSVLTYAWISHDFYEGVNILKKYGFKVLQIDDQNNWYEI